MSSDYQPTEVRREFLENDYLSEKYHVPNNVDEIAHSTSLKLTDRFGNFFAGLCIVGGLTNGSYVIRSREQERKPKTIFSRIFGNSVGTDVDFYLLVDNATEDDLNGMADVVAQEFRSKGFSIDGALNGRNPDNAFDLSGVDRHIEDEAYDLLSLPFKYVQGSRISESQRAVVEAVQKSGNAMQIWEQIKFYHDSPLALYHGTFDPEFMDYVSETWMPKKVENFGLPPLESMLLHQ